MTGVHQRIWQINKRAAKLDQAEFKLVELTDLCLQMTSPACFALATHVW